MQNLLANNNILVVLILNLVLILVLGFWGVVA